MSEMREIRHIILDPAFCLLFNDRCFWDGEQNMPRMDIQNKVILSNKPMNSK